MLNDLRIPPHPTLIRFFDNGDATTGLFYMGRQFQCFTLEDQHQNKKVYGETRIPSGIYDLALRTVGGHHQKYLSRFPDLHEGMIHLLNVPGFKYILWHIGNTDEDTAGCILPGLTAQPYNPNGFVGSSTAAYLATYPKLLHHIKTTSNPIMEIIDLDRI